MLSVDVGSSPRHGHAEFPLAPFPKHHVEEPHERDPPLRRLVERAVQHPRDDQRDGDDAQSADPVHPEAAIARREGVLHAEQAARVREGDEQEREQVEPLDALGFLEILAVARDAGQARHGLHQRVCALLENLEPEVDVLEVLARVGPVGVAVRMQRLERVAQAQERVLDVVAVVAAAPRDGLERLPLLLLFDPCCCEAQLQGWQHRFDVVDQLQVVCCDDLANEDGRCGWCLPLALLKEVGVVLEVVYQVAEHAGVWMARLFLELVWTERRNKVDVAILEWFVAEFILWVDIIVTGTVGFVFLGFGTQLVELWIAEYYHFVD